MAQVPHILIVDDNASARQTLAAQLAPCGYELSFADGAEEARRRVDERIPDVVLLDVMMPRVSGYELCVEFRADERMADTAVVLITALDSREDIVQGLAAGATEFLTKPVFSPELRIRLENLIDAKRYRELLRQQQDAALAELDKLRQQLLHMDRLATLGTFAAGVGHELNNIAAVLTGYSRLVSDSLDAGEPVDREDVRALRDASDHVAEYGRTILQIATPHKANPKKRLDIAEVIQSVAAMLRVGGRTRMMALKFEPPPEPIYLGWNRTELEQVLINICANASDAMDSLELYGHLEITVSKAQGDDKVIVVLEDNGPGMSPEILERIFEPFFTTKGPGKGTGLGMPVIKRIVEGSGGSIHVDSKVGRGTKITLELVSTPEAGL